MGPNYTKYKAPWVENIEGGYSCYFLPLEEEEQWLDYKITAYVLSLFSILVPPLEELHKIEWSFDFSFSFSLLMRLSLY